MSDLLGRLAATSTDLLDPALAGGVRALIEDNLVGIVWPERGVYLNKTRIGSLLGCQGLYLARESVPFAWTAATARGQLVHAAVRLWRGSPRAGYSAALERAEAAGDDLADLLADLSDAEHDELRAAALPAIAAAAELLPLRDAWWPVTEFPLRAEFADRKLIVTGRVDLRFGRPVKGERRTINVELKTGSAAWRAADDLALYALLELLRAGQPPRASSIVALDSGTVTVLDHDPDTLTATAHRVIAAAHTAAQLAAGAPPRLLPGPHCRWCPAQDCPERTNP